MRIQIAAKKGSKAGYEGALIVDGRFQKIGTAGSFPELLSSLTTVLFGMPIEDGTEFTCEIEMLTPAEAAAFMAQAKNARPTS